MAHVLTLPENETGRDFVVGDIHGCFPLLEQALEKVRFDTSRDRLICVGDMIDRGPCSEQCLDYLDQHWFYSLRGNHEDNFLRCWRDGQFDWRVASDFMERGMDWIRNFSAEKLAAFSIAFEQLPIAIECRTAKGTIGFVHAEVPKSLSWQQFTRKIREDNNTAILIALWGRDRVRANDGTGVAGIDRVFFGHTPQHEGARALGNCFYIDTGAVSGLNNGEKRPQSHLTLADILADRETICQPPVTGEKIKVALAARPALPSRSAHPAPRL